MSPLLPAAAMWIFAAPWFLTVSEVEIGGRIPRDRGVATEEIILTATEILSRCRSDEGGAHKPRIVHGRVNASGFFRLTLPRAAPWRISLVGGDTLQETILPPWFGTIQIPAAQLAAWSVAPTDSAPSQSASVSETVSLRVIDAQTDEPVPNAVVWLVDQPDCFAASDKGGIVHLDLVSPGAPEPLVFRVRAPFHAEERFAVTATRGGEEIVSLRRAPATLSGRVLDGGERPVTEATVRISGREEVTYTDEHGRFVARGFANGARPHVRIDHEGFRPTSRFIEAQLPGAETSLPIMTLWRPRDIVGRVVDDGEQPLEGVSVVVEGEPAGTTGPDGRFTIASLADSHVTLDFVREDLVARSLNIELGEGETPLHVGDVVLAPAVRLWGRVVNPDDEPIPEAEIFLGDRPLTGTQRRSPVALSDPNGEFVATGLPADEDVWGEVRATGYLPALARLRLSGDEDRTFVLRPAAQLFGRVLDSEGEALEDAQVSVHASDGSASRLLNLRSDAEGRFVAEDLPPGPARLRIFMPGFASYDDSVEIDEGKNLEIELHLVPEAMVVGRVTDNEGVAVTGAQVRVVTAEPAVGSLDITDAAGAFLLFGLRPGSLELDVRSAAGNGRFTTVVAPGEQLIEFQLDRVERFVLTGHALLSGGVPLPGITVRMMETVNGRPRDVVTGPDGGFRFEDLTSNNYVLLFPDEEDFVPSRESTLIALRGDVDGWVLEAQRPCSLVGRVAGLTPRELGEMAVHVTGIAPSRPAVVERSTGVFSIPRLLPGSWTLEATAIEQPRKVVSTVICEGQGEELTVNLDFDQTH